MTSAIDTPVRYAGFVRAVMLGRDGLHRDVLLECFTRAGAVAPRSYITTGNVTFTAAPSELDDIQDHVEALLADVVDRQTEVFIRSVAYLEDLLDADPFGTSPVDDAVENEVMFLSTPLADDWAAPPLVSTGGHLTIIGATETEVFVAGREIDGRRKGGGGWIERLTGQRMTARAWRTVERVARDPLPKS